jgi:hypothetical protein
MAPRLDRRQALTALLGLPLVLSGCSRAPGVGGASTTAGGTAGSSASPSRSGTQAPPDPLIAAAATREQTLAAQAEAVLSGSARTKLTSGQRGLLTAVRDAHLAHLAALRSPDPTVRPTPSASGTPAADPSFGKLPLATALRTLAAGERAAAAAGRTASLRSSGFVALLHGSISAAADWQAAGLTSKNGLPVAKAAAPQALPMVSDNEAVADLVAQLHALVYGYQLALGKLPVLSKRHQRALAELSSARSLRDRLIAILDGRKVEVPVPEPAYVPAVRVQDAASAARSILLMRSALLPYCGLFLAAADSTADRTLAFDTLAGAASVARTWGAPLRTWPGWPA